MGVIPPTAPRLRVVPVTLGVAKAFVNIWHRHLDYHAGAYWAAGVSHGEGLVGVVVVAHPQARLAQTDWRAEIVRCATDQTSNACSMLYGAAVGACRRLGWCEVVTYTLPEEGGASLKASGAEDLGLCGGGEWNRPSRSRKPAKRPEVKRKWRWRLCQGCERCSS